MFTSNIISNYAISYSMYFLMMWIIYLNKSNQLIDQKGLPAHNPGNLLALQIAGILWLGLVPLIWAKPILNIILGVGITGTTLLIALPTAALMLIYIGITQANQAVKSFQINSLPSKSFYLRYFIARIPFLISYEIFFRGLLLYFNTEQIGLGMAIFVDMLLTFIIHIYNGEKMMWACIPFSLIACLLNTEAQAVYPSIILHLSISLSFELTAVKKVLTLIKTTA